MYNLVKYKMYFCQSNFFSRYFDLHDTNVITKNSIVTKNHSKNKNGANINHVEKFSMIDTRLQNCNFVKKKTKIFKNNIVPAYIIYINTFEKKMCAMKMIGHSYKIITCKT